MLYDISTSDNAHSWLCDTLKVTGREIILDYAKYQNDLDGFNKKYFKEIVDIDIENLEIVAFQVTTSDDECEDIKKNGLRNLKWVLSNDTGMNNYLSKYGIRVDVDNRSLYTAGDTYNIEYDKTKDTDLLTDEEQLLQDVGYTVYNDYQINAFLSCKKIFDYSVVCKAPEFLFRLSELNKDTKEMYINWTNNHEPFVVKFKAKVNDFDYDTFYRDKQEYEDDKNKNWLEMKKKLVLLALNVMLDKNSWEIFAYMKSDTVITPDNIIDYVRAEDWNSNTLVQNSL